MAAEWKPRYFFHNIYGDAADLLATKPADVIALPFGWDDEAEQIRNKILQDIGAGVSGLPSLLTWVGETILTAPNGTQVTLPPRWVEYRFDSKPAPWSWGDVPAYNS
jgi:hypothetical protein